MSPPRESLSASRVTTVGSILALIPPSQKGDACNFRPWNGDLIAFAKTLDKINGGLHHHCLTDAEKTIANAAATAAGNGVIYPVTAAGVIMAKPLLVYRNSPEEVEPLDHAIGRQPNAAAITEHDHQLADYDRAFKAVESHNKKYVTQSADLDKLKDEIKISLRNITGTKFSLLFGATDTWHDMSIPSIRRVIKEEYEPNTLRAVDTQKSKRHAPIVKLADVENRIRQELEITTEMAQLGQPAESREDGLLRLQQITALTPSAPAGKAAYYAMTLEADRTIAGCLTSLAQYYTDNIRPTESAHSYNIDPSRTAYAASTVHTTEEEVSDYEQALEQFNASYAQQHSAFAATAAGTSHKQQQQPKKTWTAAQAVARAKVLSSTTIDTRSNEQRWSDSRADDQCIGHAYLNLMHGRSGTSDHCNWQCRGFKSKKGN